MATRAEARNFAATTTPAKGIPGSVPVFAQFDFRLSVVPYPGLPITSCNTAGAVIVHPVDPGITRGTNLRAPQRTEQALRRRAQEREPIARALGEM